MPILRSSDTPDTLAPKVLYLWNRKWWIILPTIAVFVITYGIMVFIPQDFQASAELYVNRLAVFQDNQLNPSTVAEVVKSDEILKEVRDRFSKKFNVPPPVFEKFVKQFKTKTEVLQDTTVKKDISPVVNLTATSRGKEETLFLMNAWLDVITSDSSNVGVREAVRSLAALKAKDAAIEKDLKSLEAQQADYRTELPLYEQMLAETIDVIAPSRLEKPQLRSSYSNPVPDSGGNVNMELQINQPPSKPPGLLAQLVDAKLKLAESDEGSTGATEARRHVAALQSAISEQITSVTQLQVNAREKRQKLESVSREIEVKVALQKELHRFMDQVDVVASLEHSSADGGGDLRVLSRPVMPELRVWPKRTIIAGVVAIAAFVLITAAFLFLQYIRDAADAALGK